MNELMILFRPGKSVRSLAGAFFFCLLAVQTACNLPAFSTPQARPTRPVESPRPPLIGWSGAPTLTPFHPNDLLGATPLPGSATPNPTPPSSNQPIYLGTWPPPFFGEPGPTPATPVPPPVPLLSDPETRNFLLVGADRQTSSFRTDTLIIVSIRQHDRQVTLISLPRDLYVYIPGWTMQRINTAYLHGQVSRYPGGGPGLLKDTLLYNLGVRIDHLAMVDFDGFRQIVDILGGIDVPLACEFTDWHIKNPRRSEQDPDNWRLYTIGPGMVHMDGDLALWYARSRLRSSDFDRGRRQQEVLRAIYARGLKLDVIPHLPQLYKELRQSVTTDLSLDDLLELAPLAASLTAPRIRSFYINKSSVVSWRTPQGAEVLLPDQAALQSLIREAMSPAREGEAARLKITVEILNGTPNLDWDLLAAERLHYAGFETRLGAPDRQDYEGTILYALSPNPDAEESDALLRALGLPSSSLVASPDQNSSAAYRLILGSDYNPCFNPATLQS